MTCFMKARHGEALHGNTRIYSSPKRKRCQYINLHFSGNIIVKGCFSQLRQAEYRQVYKIMIKAAFYKVAFYQNTVRMFGADGAGKIL